jgi:hypothetical protein
MANEKSNGNKSPAKNIVKIASILALSFVILFGSMAFLPKEAMAYYGAFSVDYPKGNDTFWGAFRSGSIPGSAGYDAISGYGGVSLDFNPDRYNYILRTYLVTSHFNDFSYYNYPNVPAWDATVTSVFAVVRAFIEMNEGWFSVRYNTTASWWDATPWNPNGAMYYMGSIGPSYDSYGWHNSSLFPYAFHNDTDLFVEYEWNITSLYTWTIPMLVNCSYPDTSKGLNIMWTSKENDSYREMDYLGIRYTAFGNYTNLQSGAIIAPTFDALSTTIVWLLMLYIPTIAMSQFIPKLGFVFGMGLMLIIMNVADSSFLPVTFVGVAAIGIILYKGA